MFGYGAECTCLRLTDRSEALDEGALCLSVNPDLYADEEASFEYMPPVKTQAEDEVAVHLSLYICTYVRTY